MRCSWLPFLLSLPSLAEAPKQNAAPVPQPRMVRVAEGSFQAAVSTASNKQEQAVSVAAFWMDRFPVTNGEFLAFVKEHPRWQRNRAPKLFVDEKYLSHWQGPLNLGSEAEPEQPVVLVSWFSARAFCEARQARLPTEIEWEYVASASETSRDARQDATWRKQILDWYSAPTPVRFAKVGRSVPNVYGVADLHGLIWEWVLDFGSTMMSGDSRDTGGADRLLFCGAAAIGAGRKNDYASFMRYAFRSSLKARYGSRNLGFRCVRNKAPKEAEKESYQ